MGMTYGWHYLYLIINSAPFQKNSMKARKEYIGYLAVVGLAYLLVFGGLLLAGNGMPYVMDNNESFSSYWHTYNLFHFDLFKSVGLADESFAFHASAHPYVHTHQGNFPRLFNSLIYALGARTIEAQIVITTFTVGVAAIFMAYHFFSKIANPMFALVICMLLITDYVLVAQWQVVTYRVWHEFFVFSSMLCVHRMADRRRFWPIIVLINFACLFYYELVFAAFTTLSSSLYAAVLCRHTPKKILSFWAMQVIGGFIALSFFAWQLYVYLGWEDFKMDAYLTFVARNNYEDGAVFLQRLREFYDSRNIVFWYNLVDGDQYRNIPYFIASLLFFDFQAHTPLLSSLCAVAVLTLIVLLIFRTGPMPVRFHPIGKLGDVWSLIRMPVLMGALGLSALHFFYGYHKSDFSVLRGAEFLAIAAAVIVLFAYTQIAQRYRLSDGYEALCKAANLTALIIIALNIPGILARLFHDWLGVGRPSITFSGYAAMSFCFAAWVSALVINDFFGSGAKNPRLSAKTSNILITSFSFSSFLALFVVLFGKDLMLGVPGNIREAFLPAGLRYFAMALISAAGATFILNCYVRDVLPVKDILLQKTRFCSRTVRLMVSVFVLLVAILIASSWMFYNPRYAPLWQDIADTYLPGPLAQLVVILVVILASAAVISKESVFNKLNLTPLLKSCGTFLLTGLCAYTVVYILSPGYVFTGYRFRQAPFTVFHTITVLALFLYLFLVAGLEYSGLRRAHTVAKQGWSRNILAFFTLRQGSPSKYIGCLSLMTFGILIFYWFGIQFSYARLMPPNHYSFLSKLSSPPYVGKSFVVNTYAAPIATQTGTWAYMNAMLAATAPIANVSNYKFPVDTTYLWFADRRTNQAYAQPDYFLCVALQSTATVIEEIRERKGLGPGHVGCEDNQLVQLARSGSGKSVYPALELREVDGDGPDVVGYERWAIVKLNWKQ